MTCVVLKRSKLLELHERRLSHEAMLMLVRATLSHLVYVAQVMRARLEEPVPQATRTSSIIISNVLYIQMSWFQGGKTLTPQGAIKSRTT